MQVFADLRTRSRSAALAMQSSTCEKCWPFLSRVARIMAQLRSPQLPAVQILRIPRLLFSAGLRAWKATELGIRPAAWVKTSLVPGSLTAERYLRRAGFLPIWKLWVWGWCECHPHRARIGFEEKGLLPFQSNKSHPNLGTKSQSMNPLRIMSVDCLEVVARGTPAGNDPENSTQANHGRISRPASRIRNRSHNI